MCQVDTGQREGVWRAGLSAASTLTLTADKQGSSPAVKYGTEVVRLLASMARQESGGCWRWRRSSVWATDRRRPTRLRAPVATGRSVQGAQGAQGSCAGDGWVASSWHSILEIEDPKPLLLMRVAAGAALAMWSRLYLSC